jgi:adenylosuccinate lyase
MMSTKLKKSEGKQIEPRRKMTQVFDAISPTEYRYKVRELVPYLSENAFIGYKSQVEVALADTTADRSIISRDAVRRIEAAAQKVKTLEVYVEEDLIRHDVMAQVNRTKARLRGKDDREARRALHRPATSYDIVDTANAMRYKEAFYKIILPDMIALERIWIEMAKQGKDTLQMGRSHLQHAEPITFGFSMAFFVSRFGKRIFAVKNAVDGLEGKFSGMVGTYAPASLFVDDPIQFEGDVLGKLGLKPNEISSQIKQQEDVLDLNHAVTSSFGVLANWALNMYILEMPEVAEISQPGRGKDISRSSNSPHKANPIGLENIISLWKKVMSYMNTSYLDQISLFSRDLTNSATSRFVPEIYDLFDYAVRRASRVSKSLVPNPHNMQRNFNLGEGYISSGPLQLLLSSYGHPNSHKAVGELADAALEEGISLMEVAQRTKGLRKYLRQFSTQQMETLLHPAKYIGEAANVAERVANNWEGKMNELMLRLS